MYFFLILFFISLCGIVLMIGRKLVFANIKKNEYTEKFISETLDFGKIKNVATKNAKKYGFIIFVGILRFSIKSSHFLKSKYCETKNKIKESVNNYIARKNKEPKEKEVSNFLKMILDYKHRIKDIKHKIKKEEGIE